MATDVAVQTLSLAATTPTALSADAAGNTFTPVGGGPHFLRVIYGSGGSITATIDDPNTVTPEGASAFNPDVPIVVASGSRIVKISNPSRFAATATGKVSIAWSSATSVTFELYT
jgi:hypothetical protein